VHRRTFLGAGAATAAAVLTGCGSASPTSPGFAPPVTPVPEAAAATSAAGLVFTSGRTLRRAETAPAYGAGVRDTIARYLKPTPDHPQHPFYAGAVALVNVDGDIMMHEAVGDALRYNTGPVELAPSKRVAMRTDSIFDLASITKVFTSLLVLQLAEQGLVDLTAPVARYLPEFQGPGKAAVTLTMLLAHTSGLPDGITLSTKPTVSARRAAITAMPLVKDAVPGDTFRYSDTNLLVLGLLVEKITGQPLDVVMRQALIGPLGLRDTGFKPLEWSTPPGERLVATDATPGRGLLRGVVHDPNAHALGGVAGHAGLFSTSTDLAILGQMLVNGGEYGGKRVLSEETVRKMLVNVNPGIPAIDPEQRPTRTAAHGLGVELNQSWFMGRLGSSLTFGHTGFTGTSIVVDPARRVALVLLTSRAHPDWHWAKVDGVRAEVADVVAAGIYR
jgi:CubicO group peptidase (beta-lactamase class C family)